MSYVNINTLEKVEAVDIMLANPQVSFPNRGWSDEELEPYGYAELHFPVEHPFPSTYEKLVEGTPAKIGDKYYIQFETVPMSTEEIGYKKAQIYNDIIAQTQSRLDNFAQSRNYDTILSLATYATSTVPKFAQEGQYGVEARDLTWAKLYEIMQEVEAGIREYPTSYADIEPQLPTLEWPNQG